MSTFILFAAGILMGSVGALSMKVGANRLSHFEFTFRWFLNLISNPYVIIGFILYFIPAVIWVYVLTKYPVSFVQPILALTYVVTPILALLILKEPVPALRWIGIIIIIAGVFIVSRS